MGKRVNKKLPKPTFTRTLRKPEILINSFRMSKDLDKGYIVELDAIINGSIAKCVGILDTVALRTGKTRIRVVTPEKERTEHYFSTNNIYEIAIYQKDAPLLYQLVYQWWVEVENICSEGDFSKELGALVVPPKQEPTSMTNLLSTAVWVGRKGYTLDNIKEKIGGVDTKELEAEPEVKLPLWVWSYFNTRPLYLALSQLYYDEGFDDIKSEVVHAAMSYNSEKFGDNVDYYLSLDKFVAKAYLEEWGYIMEDYYLCPLPGVPGYHLYYNTETGNLEPVSSEGMDEEELLVPGSIIPDEYKEYAKLIIDGSNNEEAVVNSIKEEWAVRSSKFIPLV